MSAGHDPIGIVNDMDRCGFFIGNGTFGLEKRDNLKDAIQRIQTERDELKALANSVITQANGDLTDEAFRPYVKALAVNALARL